MTDYLVRLSVAFRAVVSDRRYLAAFGLLYAITVAGTAATFGVAKGSLEAVIGGAGVAAVSVPILFVASTAMLNLAAPVRNEGILG